MAISIVNSTGLQLGSGIDTDTVTLGWTPTIGNDLFVLASGWRTTADGGFQMQAPTDDQGNTYVVDREQNQSGAGTDPAAEASISRAKVTATAAGMVVTIDPAGVGNNVSWCVIEVAGLAASSPLDRTGAGTSTNGTLTATASAANTQADELVLAVMALNANADSPGISNPPTGYTGIYRNENVITPPSGEAGQGSYKIVSATETSTVTWTHGQTTRPSAAVICTYKAASGTQFPQSVGGTLGLAATLATACAYVKALTGVLSFEGPINGIKQVLYDLEGTLGLAGTASGLRTVLLALVATLGLSGVLAKQAGRSFTGALGTAGVLMRSTGRALMGELSSSGALAAIRTTLLALAGVVSTAGALIKHPWKQTNSTVASAGAVLRLTQKAVAGALSTSGALSAIRTLLLSLAGTVGLVGAIARQTQATASGAISLTGQITRQTGRGVAGALILSGAIVKQVRRTLVGVLSMAASLVASTFSGDGPRDVRASNESMSQPSITGETLT